MKCGQSSDVVIKEDKNTSGVLGDILKLGQKCRRNIQREKIKTRNPSGVLFD